MFKILRDGEFFAEGISLESIAAIADEDVSRYSFAPESVFEINHIANKPIYDALEDIDLRSIRALRANDTQRLNELEQQAAALRAQLLPVS